MSQELTANSTLSHYRIVEQLGAGGMGEVYLAQDTKLDRKVAIKFLNQEFSKDADKLNRFIQEAKAVSALNHPNILTVFEIGEKDGTNYIVTEFIEGKTLREQLSPEKTVSLSQILGIGVQVAEALSAAHQAGIIHRDIKPENIMIRQDGYAKVLDFGLAKLTEQKPKAGVLSEDTTRALVKTNPGMVLGTVSYMSPEQAGGKETDARTDIWSLGVVLYEMLSGKVPFTGETINHTIVSILEKEPLLLENVPDELQRIVRKTLTKDKEMRYQTARDLLIDLKNLRRTLDIQGELERSVVPNKTGTAASENATHIYAVAAATTQGERDAISTQAASGPASSLEYAVTQVKSHKLAVGIIGVALLGIISAAVYLGFIAKPGGGQISSIAVMPFANGSGNPEVDYLSDGLTESLINSLSRLPNLSVKARSTVFRYKGKDISPQQAGSELAVQAVLNGRVVQRGDQLTVSVDLVNARTGDQIWGQQYSGKVPDAVSLQNQIASEVSQKLQSVVSREDQAKLIKGSTTNADAYLLYLKGRYQTQKYTKEGLAKGLDSFNQAIALDPRYALAYDGIADNYIAAADWYMPSKDALPKAGAAAQKALEFDSQLAEAHSSLAVVHWWYDWNWSQAALEFTRALELDPKDAKARVFYGWFLIGMGRAEAGVAESKRAVTLDPLSVEVVSVAATNLYFTHRYDEAVAMFRNALEMDQNYWLAHSFLGRCYQQQGKLAEATAEFQRAMEIEKDVPENYAMLAQTYGIGGRKGEAEKVVAQLREMAGRRHIPAYNFALAYVGLGDSDQAFAWLERAYADRSFYVTWMKYDPQLDSVRSDPRLNELMRRVGLPE